MPSLSRRGYSDDDLNNALQDILTRKLGTRKAAVQYNVPRSTLRNKVNKLALEAKRNNAQTPAELLQLQLELEHDLSSDEGESDASNISTPQPADVNLPLLGSISTETSHKQQSTTPNSSSSQLTPGLPTAQLPLVTTPNWLDQNMLLRTLLLTMGARLHPNIDENMTLRDFFSMMLTAGTTNNTQLDTNNVLNNGKAAPPAPAQSPNVLDQRLLLQLLQPQTVAQQSPQFMNRLPKSETPETSSSLELNDTYDDPTSSSSILKIPSFKPVVGGGTSSAASLPSTSPVLSNSNNNTLTNANRNGDSPHSAASPHLTTNSMLAAAVSGAGGSNNKHNNMSVISPPLLGRQSPTKFSSLRDVFASKFQRTLNDSVNKDPHTEYKKPSISVVKNIGGTDTSRFGAAPNLLSTATSNSPGSSGNNSHHHHVPGGHMPHTHHSNHHLHHQLSRQEVAALAAGKGTRPKRGKYRNYDRDSLIEAVKAVQRGEMSVHRAGSYYGVPHSTLEYKVKERHLMRPRKREPKPQPGLDSSSAKVPSSLTGVNSLDKSKTAANVTGSNNKLSNVVKNNNNNNNNSNNNNTGNNNSVMSANGLKLAQHNMFDAALASQMQYPTAAAAHLFWPHTQAAAAAAFGPLAHIDFTTHMQRYQENMLRAGGVNAAAVAADNNTAGHHSPNPNASHLTALTEQNNQHELFENTAANGASSFLDGIIRQTLDRKSERDIGAVSESSSGGGGGALLDHLLVKKTPLPFTNSSSNRSHDDVNISAASSPSLLTGVKRIGSPLAFTTDIKRERTSPTVSSDNDDTSHSGESTNEHNNNNNNNNKNNNNNSILSNNGNQSIDNNNSTHKSELLMQQNHNNNSNNSDYNGSSSKLDINNITTKSSSTVAAQFDVSSSCSSILQEKLAQIKAEQDEENL